MEFAERLRELMAERGISERELARRVNCDRSYIHLLKHGKRRAGPRMVQLLDDTLGANGSLAALSRSPGTSATAGVSVDGSQVEPWEFADVLTRSPVSLSALDF